MLKNLVSILCLLQLVSSFKEKEEPLNVLIGKLADKINSFQVLKPLNASPPFHWYEKKGLFRSDIRLNFAGEPPLQALRNSDVVRVFDNDMFSSGWIVTALLESNLYGKYAPVFDSKRLDLVMSSMSDYNNKNDNSKTSIIRTFWQQELNATTKIWYQQPTNIRKVTELLKDGVDLIPFKEIIAFLKFFKINNLEKLVESIAQNAGQLPETFLEAFNIPPDFDDTYLNLGMGATLSKFSSVYPDIYSSWLKNNTNIDHLVEATIKYSYDPFVNDVNKNLIDPRTYLYARGFINQAYENGSPVSLITTWIQNVEEQHTLKQAKVSMPFNLNNIDVTVGANFVYGATSGSIYNINNYGDYLLNSTDLQRVYLNTTKFISWAIKSNFSSRPDLAQVYYPSKFNFLWYASRTLFLIENEIRQAAVSRDKIFIDRFNSLKDILVEVKSYLQDAFETTVTDYLLKSLIWTDTAYICDFLGQDDKDIFGRPEKNSDDCVFSTAQTLNIIIATWTFQDPLSKQLFWKSNTPANVKLIPMAIVKWLQKTVLDNKYKKLNAFFSGSVKGFTDLPFWYPANYLKLLNGTDINPSDNSPAYLSNSLIGISGIVNESDYQNMLKQTHFNITTPIDFKGYNAEIGFPFWSSEPYTYAVSLLAISQFCNLNSTTI